MRPLVKLAVSIAVVFTLSFFLMSILHVSGPLGDRIAGMVAEYRGGAPLDLNSLQADVAQSIALTIFFTVIIATVMKMEWRVAAAITGVGVLAITGLTPPQNMIYRAIDWRLLVFLIGSMTLAGILREAGVFNRLAVSLVEKSTSAFRLLLLLGLFSALLSMILGEVTSIIYAVLVVLELRRVLEIDVKPLIVYTVLATNTGSVALPVGNPIGVYIAFTANISVAEFLAKCLPLSLLEVLVLILVYRLVLSNYVERLNGELKQSRELIAKLTAARTIDVTPVMARHTRIGLLILAVFTGLVVLNEKLAEAMSLATGVPVDPDSLLAFIPYLSIALALLLADPSSMDKLLSSAVEWPSIIFFMSLFILSYALSYTGAIAKIAYGIAMFSEPGSFTGNMLVVGVLLAASAMLSSVLDNLSVIVALTQPVTILVQLGLSRVSYLALLYGGVFGGNYTPIGSTANIVAVSMAEREKIAVSWGEWLRIALVSTTLQITVALLWSYLWLLAGG
ncbi:SLC13 family permease [Desulfurococcus mucosus]|uniref:Citrate transporter n=1 Tax=Desulfurococcus mucosus (strain ATCC 35584 / DSM 2162 / JCM 9187 / O7/1) TaxID=765177 RepID=E8R804_DESM0|nr:SLC13 family permease [Desulfurococcus mucosus]ADV64630.1 Citrate transporter [Desulfurococcus mucosus DSM 2162]